MTERGEAWERKIPISYFPISKGYGDPACRVPACSRERVREWASTSALKLAAFKRASEGGSSREIEAAMRGGAEEGEKTGRSLAGREHCGWN